MVIVAHVIHSPQKEAQNVCNRVENGQNQEQEACQIKRMPAEYSHRKAGDNDFYQQNRWKTVILKITGGNVVLDIALRDRMVITIIIFE